MAAPTQRKDPILEDLLAKGSFSLALKHLNKKLKKQPKSTENHIAKAVVLQRLDDAAAAVAICQELAKQSPPIFDFDHLFQLHQLLASLEATGRVPCSTIGPALWKNAIKAQSTISGKLSMTKEWIHNAISLSQWSQVNQAAQMAFRDLPDSHPEKRIYFFWQIVALYLSSTQAGDEKMAGLQRSLACRMADQSFADMPDQEASANSTPGKWISSRSEFEIFLQTSGTAAPAKTLELLEQKGLGPSAVSTNDRWGVLRWNRELLRGLKRYPELRKLARETISHAQKTGNEWKQNDYGLWSDLSLGHIDVQDEKSVNDHMAFAEHAIATKNGSRSARMILLDLLQLQMTGEGPSENNSVLESAFQNVFKSHAEALQASPVFERDLADLTGIWSKAGYQLPRELRNTIRDQAKLLAQGSSPSRTQQLKWITAEANALTMDLIYWEMMASSGRIEDPETLEPLVMPRPQNSAKQSLDELSLFVASSIRLYKVARVHTASLPVYDRDPGDRAVVLAARMLSRAADMTGQQRFRVLGTCLLQFLADESIHNSTARMMLIVRYQGLGLHSLAAQAYAKLGVKSILFESLVPVFFPRLGVLHPRPTSDFNPYQEATKGLKFYADALRATGDYQEHAMEEENYSSAIKMQDFRTQLRDSPVRRLLRLERRRIARMTGVKPSEDQLQFDTFAPSQLVYPNPLEFQQMQPLEKPVEVSRNCGPPVNTVTLAYLEYVDQVMELVYNEPPAQVESLSIFKEGSMPQFMLGDNKQGHFLGEATVTERYWTGFAMNLSRLARGVYSNGSVLSEVKLLLAKINSLLTSDQLGGPRSILDAWAKCKEEDSSYFPTWQLFEACYTRFDMLKAAVVMSSKIQASLKERFKKEKAELRQEVQKSATDVQGLAMAQHQESRSVMHRARESLTKIRDVQGIDILDVMMQPRVDESESSRDAQQALRTLYKEALELMGPENMTRIFRSFVNSGIESCDSFLSLPADLSKAV